MTFKEWFNSAPHRAKYTDDHPAYLAAKEAWDAAHKACAKVCADLWCKEPEPGDARDCYDAIRARGQE